MAQNLTQEEKIAQLEKLLAEQAKEMESFKQTIKEKNQEVKKANEGKAFKKYFMQPTCDKISQIIETLSVIDVKMQKIFETLVQKGEELKQYDISQQMNLEWDIIEERKANVEREKAKVDKLILIIETLLKCISLLLEKAQEILERGQATDEDDKILGLLGKEIQRFIDDCKNNSVLKEEDKIIKIDQNGENDMSQPTQIIYDDSQEEDEDDNPDVKRQKEDNQQQDQDMEGYEQESDENNDEQIVLKEDDQPEEKFEQEENEPVMINQDENLPDNLIINDDDDKEEEEEQIIEEKEEVEEIEKVEDNLEEAPNEENQQEK